MEGITMDLQMTAHESIEGLSFKRRLPVIGAMMAVSLVLLTIFLIVTSVTNFRSETNYLLNQNQTVPGRLGMSNQPVSAPAESDFQPVFRTTQNLTENFAPTAFFIVVGAVLLLFATFFIFILAFKN